MSKLQVFNENGTLVFDSDTFKVPKARYTINYASYTYRNVGSDYYFTFKYTIPAVPSTHSHGFVYFEGRPTLVRMGSSSVQKELMIDSTGSNLSNALANAISTGKVFLT